MRRVLVYLAIVLVLGCSFGEELQDPGDPVDITPSMLAGTWHGGTERFITFREDGTFSAINLPSAPFHDFLNRIDFDPARRRLDGSGTWTLGGLSGRSTGPQATVHLSFDLLAGVPAYYDGPDLSALRPGDGKVYLVFFYVGDQGNSWTGYLKCDADCVVPSPESVPPEPRVTRTG